MPRYGDLDELCGKLYAYRKMAIDPMEDKGLLLAILCAENAPTADAVEVVRCKDCKHAAILEFSFGGEAIGCEILHRDRKESDYCSYGERRDDG